MYQLAWDLNSDRYDRSQTTDLNNSATRYHPATALTAFVHYNSACRPLLLQSGLRGGRGVRAVGVACARCARGGLGDIKREFRKKSKV